MNKRISVRFTREGFHNWPDAPMHRSYLASRHRHLFHVQVSLDVKHNDREVEFHDLLDFCQSRFPSGDFGSQSCEALADDLQNHLLLAYPGRGVEVQVWEDGEVGAILRYYAT